ncbi:PREDICTED: TMV resistance protein N-like [Nelumbo nucifera]|uniref:TMV resistance protein N-like n=2 Tax=Nelumbo nucifera TaxID=4432 RepID=A0A1U7YXN0_NELNU|nr:PREDICTED: TMV resistance protein N-like [Nelumbo nucifera]DAD22976.1 TPA_asm: hypothetical protein HUJ06_024439 [Nelumbo nucifera]
MQRSLAKNLHHQIVRYRRQAQMVTDQPCDVFINHRGIDTKRTVAGLLYHHLRLLKFNPFLDNKNLKPGDKLFENIDSAIRNCKVGVAVFSPNYCKSYFCLHELALMMESRKKVIPIFCDIKPSELQALDDGTCPSDELQRFRWALQEAKYTVGLTFSSNNGNWSKLVTSASEIVVNSLIELEGEGEDQGYYGPITY